jgi:hypothetical protein
MPEAEESVVIPDDSTSADVAVAALNNNMVDGDKTVALTVTDGFGSTAVHCPRLTPLNNQVRPAPPFESLS